MMAGLDGFIPLDAFTMIQVVLLGFIGGVLSGFIGSGGAFFMTPGMMNLGVPGAIAVASNITHKFGKALVGSRRHRELGNVDRKLALFMLATSALGIQIAVWLNSMLLKTSGSHGESSSAAGDLYISVVFVASLTPVSIAMLRDVVHSFRSGDNSGRPGSRMAEAVANLRLPPTIDFRVSETHVSLWVVTLVGLIVGYMAGTIGVGGFLGVPAMIYLFGVPTTVAAGTELYLAVYMGAWGALNYAWLGLVDVRLTLLLYGGSLIGVFIGVYGTKVVREVMIRMVTGVVILVCVVSRLIAIPVYLRQLGKIEMHPSYDPYLNSVSKGLLFLAGISGLAMILYLVVKAHRQRMSIQTRLMQACSPADDASSAERVQHM
ncbi:MAG: sulfite exporter TauE/SafE family protein [Acidobacteria bacterium]|nr:sulfite exporter TauE/SafE family protein [Acidobacteriota bacterium]